MARIRTVKPEFWRHNIMARQDDFTQLLALALLNYADDHGYFMADPALIRGEVMPFREDLATISRSLAKLSAARWIEVRDHPERGAVGKIVTWDDHQRVDHPKASKIKDLFILAKSSRSPREVLAPEVEQGTGNREQGETLTPAALRLPDAGASKPPAPEKPTDPVKDEIWQTGKAILIESEGMSKDRAGSLLGKLVKDYGQRLVLDAVRDCAKTTPAKPSEWLVARCQERRPNGDALEARNRAVGEAWLAKMQGRVE